MHPPKHAVTYIFITVNPNPAADANVIMNVQIQKKRVAYKKETFLLIE